MTVAIVVPSGFDREKAMARVAQVAGAPLQPEDITLLSNAGRHLDLSRADGKPAHLYATTSGRFRRIFVVKEFPALYANDFTVAWLGLLLADQGEQGELWLEIPDESSRARRNQLTLRFLRERLPSAPLAEHEGGWYRLQASSALAGEAAALPTIYPALHGRAEDFFEIYGHAIDASSPIDGSQRDAAERSLIYGLYGANQKGFVVERILADHGLQQALRGLDAGGGYGFLAAELATKGHDLLVTDCDDKKIDLVGPWLAERCGLGSRLQFVAERIESIGCRQERFDFVSFFGCLLYLDKKDVAGVIAEAMQLLKPGGLLLVHENPREAGKPGSQDYERRFAAQTLAEIIDEQAGRFRCYSMFTGRTIEWDQAARSVIMAAVQRQR